MIEIKKHKNSTYQFELKTSTGQILLSSIPFPNEEVTKKKVEELHPLITKQTSFERRTNHSGKFHFNLKDANGSVIGNSQLYSSEAGMENGIKNLKRRISVLSPTSS